MSTIKPCLWFQSEAEQAADAYVGLFPNSRIVNVMRAGEGNGALVIGVEFILDGTSFTAINGRQENGFNDSHSFMVPCETQAEVDRYWDALLANGGRESRCGWLVDRFGVSWQIIPNALPRLLGGPDRARAGRVMQAMLKMNKLDVAALESA